MINIITETSTMLVYGSDTEKKIERALRKTSPVYPFRMLDTNTKDRKEIFYRDRNGTGYVVKCRRDRVTKEWSIKIVDQFDVVRKEMIWKYLECVWTYILGRPNLTSKSYEGE